MKESLTTPSGRYVANSTAGENVRAFVPNMLPPHDLPSLGYHDLELLERANRSLGRLDGLSALLPDASLFIYFYVRKEAVLSSQIEGTQSSLSELLLYLSLFLKQHREEYYHLLQRVRENGDWLSWIRFFLEGVRETSSSATDTARRIMALFAADHQRVGGLGRSASSALRVHEYLQRKPLTPVSGVAHATGLSFPTVQSAFASLQELGLLNEITGKDRGRIYAYSEYLSILGEGA